MNLSAACQEPSEGLPQSDRTVQSLIGATAAVASGRSAISRKYLSICIWAVRFAWVQTMLQFGANQLLAVLVCVHPPIRKPDPDLSNSPAQNNGMACNDLYLYPPVVMGSKR